jgi:hypothetical protein
VTIPLLLKKVLQDALGLDRKGMQHKRRETQMTSKIIWSVSYYVEAERMWQFAGEGDSAWSSDRADYLRAAGHDKVRRRWRAVGYPVIEAMEA